ncbi:Uncharacterized protein Fot_14542 [Forsythia ovata]|uniref:Uncharacterized protein n=1 Tax=Forsythia ovata TaxID=205694 RepID=A0ABD1W6L8_9LAMI
MEPKSVIKDVEEIRAETIYYVQKHQIVQQPRLSVGKKPEGVESTMQHPVKLQPHISHQDDYGSRISGCRPQRSRRPVSKVNKFVVNCGIGNAAQNANGLE